MVIADPAAELLRIVQRTVDAPSPSPPSPSDRAAALLLRRRFGVSLPPPYADPADPGDPEAAPVRLAVAADGPAIAAVKWRAFGQCYRGVLPDAFLDGREVVPPVAFWIGRATLPPSRRHSLFVLGRPGHVLGYCDAGPCRDADVDPAVTGEVYELYLDPTLLRAGGGRRLFERTVEQLRSTGSTDRLLWVLEANHRGRAFYEACGWTADGAGRSEELGPATFTEIRYRADRGPTRGDF